MTEISKVRLAVPQDESGIMACLKLKNSEEGIFGYSERRTQETVHGVLHPNGSGLSPMIGVIGSSEDIQATICLTLSQLFDTEEWHLGELWNYIRPDCRAKGHINGLLRFATECSDKVGIPLLSATVSNKRTAARARIYEKVMGPPIGAFFAYQPSKAVA